MGDRSAFFITGTDTSIGKTYVSRLLADMFGSVWKTTYMKPVQTGCTKDEGGILRAPDFDEVMAGAAVMNADFGQHVPYCFEPACSPHLAASLAGEAISLPHIKECFSTVSECMDVTIVEGAGGIFAPLSETLFMIDLIVHLNIPVILVTCERLGTLNHTFLSLRVLRESGISIAGIVLNNTSNDSPTYIRSENRRMIEMHTRPVPFLELPFGAEDSQQVKDFCDAIV